MVQTLLLSKKVSKSDSIMKRNLLKILGGWPKCYIGSGDLSPYLECSKGSLHSLLKRAVKEGVLIRLKRDFYLIADKILKIKPEAFEIAPLLYGPSYVSLESALSFHGWIPEAVPTITCACSKKNRKFETYAGLFMYYRIPVFAFHLGVSSYDMTNLVATFLMADPWKAIADLVYLRKKHWPNIVALANDMRVELELMQHSDLALLVKLSEIYPSERVQKALKILAKDLNG